MHPALRTVALLALALLGIATCVARGSGDNTSWRAASIHTLPKHKR